MKENVCAYVNQGQNESGEPNVRSSPAAGRSVAEMFEFDGGRQVTVYVPQKTPEAVVFAGDGLEHS